MNAMRRPLTLAGVILLGFVLLASVFGPHLTGNDPVTVNMAERLQPPSLQYPLGTDAMGRCLFTRLAVGGQYTLGITAAVVAAIVLLGIPLGLFSGYKGGRIDAIVMRAVDGITALPEFILAIAAAGFLGASLGHVVIAIVAVKWTGYARIARSVALAERDKEYVLAARVAGSGPVKIVFRHLAPHIVPPLLVLAAVDVGKVMLSIAALSYLGLGAQPPMPEWGAMLNEGRTYFQSVPALMLLPGAAIMLAAAACNLIGDGLRDTLDVQRT
ncbi:nickel transporter permease [Paenibacillus sp.]|uniref:nickel transporter permease n=1 Tax=Paenibacillus sp. TaxID=58172 RepID=UPI002D27F706|nr:nickel transporter permease [Paenibacillus sp.]HZG86887.1 nickel transporter permease [Paenibacillus sp.]